MTTQRTTIACKPVEWRPGARPFYIKLIDAELNGIYDALLKTGQVTNMYDAASWQAVYDKFPAIKKQIDDLYARRAK